MQQSRGIDSRPVKVIVVIVMAAAIATLGLHRQGGEISEAVADHPLDEHFDPLMPRYPRVAEFPLGEALEAGEGEMRMSYFSTEDPPFRVARYYRTVWEQDGLSVHHNVTSSGGVVGTFDPRIKGARSVTIVASGARTWVFPATVERPLDTANPGDMGADDGLPVYPGSASGLTLRTSDHGRESVVATYSNDGGLSKNVSFFREQMSDRGWRETEVPSFDELEGHRALRFVNDGRECTINLTPLEEDERRVVVSVILESDAQ